MGSKLNIETNRENVDILLHKNYNAILLILLYKHPQILFILNYKNHDPRPILRPKRGSSFNIEIYRYFFKIDLLGNYNATIFYNTMQDS